MDALLTAVNAAFMDIRFPSVSYPEITEEDASMDLSKVKINRKEERQLEILDTPVYSVYVLYTSCIADVDDVRRFNIIHLVLKLIYKSDFII